jgi:hypothetical protein
LPRSGNDVTVWVREQNAELRECSRQAKSHDHIAEIGGVPLASGGAKEPGRVKPRAASVNTHAVHLRFVGASVSRCAIVTFCIAVLRPLPDVADDIVQTKSVRRLQSDRMRMPLGVCLEPGIR